MWGMKQLLVPAISPAEASARLDPHIDALVECVSGGWQTWEELAMVRPDLTKESSSRTRASWVNDQIWARARRKFAATPGARIIEQRGCLVLILDEETVLRFKKLNRRRLASNIATTQQVAYYRQEVLPGFPAEAARLCVGYQLDLTQTKIAAIFVTYQKDGMILWSFPIEVVEPSTRFVAISDEAVAKKSRVHRKQLENPAENGRA